MPTPSEIEAKEAAARQASLRELLESAVREWAPEPWESLAFMEEAQRAIDVAVFGRDLSIDLARVESAIDDEAFDQARTALEGLPPMDPRVGRLQVMLDFSAAMRTD